MKGGPRVGLALGGGFLRGAAHIGVLKVLLQEGIPVHAVAGSSSGSIAAALYAVGKSPAQMREIALNIKPSDIFDTTGAVVNLLLLAGETAAKKFHFPFPYRIPAGLMKGRNLERLLDKMIGKDIYFDRIEKVCLVVTAVDARDGSMIIFMPEKYRLKSYYPTTVIPPKDMVVICDLKVTEAVRASSSIPGLFEPKKIKGHVLVDGGIRENVPAQVLKKIGMDVVLAVDVGYDGEVYHKVDTPGRVLGQSIDIMASESTLIKLNNYADVVIRPEIKNMSVWDFESLEYAIDQGETKAREMLPEIHRVTGINYNI